MEQEIEAVAVGQEDLKLRIRSNVEGMEGSGGYGPQLF
jgi:hypothetical protein